jgi:hypothetical protein
MFGGGASASLSWHGLWRIRNTLLRGECHALLDTAQILALRRLHALAHMLLLAVWECVPRDRSDVPATITTT